MKKLVLTLAASFAVLVAAQVAEKIDQTATGKYSYGRTSVELMGACSYIGGLKCWDMSGRVSQDLTSRVSDGMETEPQNSIGFRKLNRIVLYRQTMGTHRPGDTPMRLYVEGRGGDFWFGRESRPAGPHGETKEVEFRAQMVVAESNAKSLGVTAKLSVAKAPVRLACKIGEKGIVYGHAVSISKIRKATAAEAKRGRPGNRSGWVIEVNGTRAYASILGKDGQRLMTSSDEMQMVGATKDTMIYFTTVNPAKIKWLAFQEDTDTRIEIVGAPVNPR